MTLGALEERFRGLERYVSHAEQPLVVQRLHQYPSRYLGQLAQCLIEEFSMPGDLVLDPMVGSGTSLEVALRLGRRAIASDLNPISMLILRTFFSDTSNVATDHVLSEFKKRILEGFHSGATRHLAPPARKQFHNWHIWYRPEVLQELCFIRSKIEEEELLYQPMLLLALSRICKTVSNADPRDLFPQRDRNNLERDREDVLEHFLSSLEQVENLLKEAEGIDRSEGGFFFADATVLPIPDRCVDLILCSPPYSFALEYVRLHQLSLAILGFSRQALREARRNYIGTDKIKPSEILSQEKIDACAHLMGDSFDLNNKWERTLCFYIHRLTLFVAESARVLKNDGKLGVIIGESSFRGNKVNNVDMLERIARQFGLELKFKHKRDYFTRRMNPKRNQHSGKIDADHILVFGR